MAEWIITCGVEKMGGLENRECVPCMGGVPPLNEEDARKLLVQIDQNWKIIDNLYLNEIIVKLDQIQNLVLFYILLVHLRIYYNKS